MDHRPIFQAEKPIIDSYDSAISKSQNEVDRFNAAIMLTPAQLSAQLKADLAEGESTFFESLDQYEKWPEYLQKNLQGIGEFYKTHSANLERLFHKSIGIPDISDENFAGNQSGVAIAFKLIPLEFLVALIEAYFRRGLEKRKQFYDDFMEMFGPSLDYEDYKTTVTWKRNIPIDERAKVEVAAILSSIISPEGVLRFLPNTIVPDIEDELAAIEGNIDVGEDELDADPTETGA
jgi:SPP1 family phage portal protein